MRSLEIISRTRGYATRLIEQSTDFSDSRIKNVAILYCVIWLLHGVLDPGISYIGIEVFELGYEGNPIMRIPMQQGLGVFILVHIPLYVGLFIAYVTTVDLIKTEFERGKSTTYRLALAGLTLLIGWGIWLNLSNVVGMLYSAGLDY